MIDFGTGLAFSDVTTGQYVAAVAKQPSDTAIRITPCSELSKTILYPLDEPITDDKPFDITITSNKLRVTVVNAATRLPIQSARVVAAALKRGTLDEVYFAQPKVTNSDGIAEFEDLPPRSTSLCVSAPQFQKLCTSPLSPFEGSHAETIALRPASARAGRVLGGPPWNNGVIFWVSPTGNIIEESSLQSDGSFDVVRPHGFTEHVVITSPTTPLFVLPAPAVGDREHDIELSIPMASARTLQVQLGPKTNRANGLVLIVVDGMIVPPDALLRHQLPRRSGIAVTRTKALVIHDIAATGTISVALGPELDGATAATYSVAWPHQQIGPSGLVVFE